MFDVLLATRHGHSRQHAGAAVSVLAHTLVIAAAIGATRTQPPRATEPTPPDEIIYDWRPKPQPPAPAHSSAPPSSLLMTPLPVLVAPIDVPAGLPAIEPATLPTPDAYFGVRTVGSTRGDSPAGALTSGSASTVYTSSSVDKPAMQVAGVGAPLYPELLRSAGVEGEVIATFVVDTAGRAEMTTLRLVRATRPEFADAVRLSLPRARFLPAEAAGRKVRQRVELPFAFSIRK
jgi:protein TonB